MALNEQEMLLLVGIREDPAYLLLMEKLDAVIEDVTDTLHAASPSDSLEILPYWKALRTVYFELKHTPQSIVEYLEQIGKEVSEKPADPIATRQLREFFGKVQQIQQDTDATQESVQNLFKQVGSRGYKPESYGNLI